jgi:hypothetical protein
MRRAGLVGALLLATAHLPACAVGGSSPAPRGEAGVVAWKIVDIQQEIGKQGSWMRWTFSIVLTNRGATGIGFEQVEIASQAAGTADGLSGGMGTEWFAQRLEPGAELTIRRSHVAACTFCAPPDLQRVFADGVVVYYTLVGRDDRGAGVRVPVAIRLNQRVGEPQ